MAPATARFTGFTPQALTLLAQLAKHNDRAWFAPRKERFAAELLEPLRDLVVDASDALRREKLPLSGDPKRSLFRIYRDVRFGPNKAPYKTNLAAYLSFDGARDTPGGLYVHVEPKRSFLAAAFYQIDKPLLERWRGAVAARPAAFAAVVRALARRGLEIADDGDALLRMPRGFEGLAAHPLAPYLRMRSFVVRRDLADADLHSTVLVERIVSLAKDAKPLYAFGWALL